MKEHSLNIIIFNNKPYIRVIPGKKLFQSNLIHSVVNRGDVFAVCLEDGVLTILPGVAEVEKSKAVVWIKQTTQEPTQTELLWHQDEASSK